MLVTDRRPLLAELKASTNADVALDVDADRFLQMFLQRLRML
jgi:hypothetical protein